MKIKYIEIYNFKSIGPDGIKLDFEDRGTLSLLEGKNGSGKSTINHAILWGLYGKIPEGKITDLPNRIYPKDICVIIYVETRGFNLKITRTTGLEVEINGNEWEEARKNDMQTILEREYYSLPYHVFKNTLVLSINDFYSYLTMSPAEKRQIFDKIFGFDVLNKMIKENGEVLKQKEREIETEKVQINHISKSLKQVKDEYEKAKKGISTNFTQKKDEIEKQIETEKEAEQRLETELSECTETLTKLNQLVKENEQNENKIKWHINDSKKSIKLYEKNNCPTCGSSLSSKKHKEKKQKLEEQLVIFKEMLQKKKDKKELLNQKWQTWAAKKEQIQNEKRQKNFNIQTLKKEFKSLKQETNVEQYFEPLIQKTEEDFSAAKASYKITHRSFSKYKKTDSLLKNAGIKQTIINSIIPVLNKSIKEYSIKLHLKYHIEFDADFNVIITDNEMTISPYTLSAGERKKYDFVIIMSVLKLIKTKFSNFNLLFLDEIFSSIDEGGIYDILGTLKEFCIEYKMQIFVVNHGEISINKFDNVYKFTKEQFTEIEKTQ